MDSIRHWKEVTIPSDSSEPTTTTITINSRDTAEQGDRLIRDAQRPLDIKDREHALRRSTATRM